MSKLANIWVLLLITIGWANSAHAGTAPLSRYSDIVAYLQENPRTTLEDLLFQIDPEIRKRFQLVYESRSPNPSTLARPRIILTNEDASLILGIPGDSEARRGNIIEVIESSPTTGELHFREIAFESEGVKVDPSPQLCMHCHGNTGSEFKRVSMRPIWDGYPDWPGVYGSSHNDAVFYNTSKYGNGTIPKLEFEENALSTLKKEMPSLPRYSALIGLGEATTSQLSHVGSMFTEALLRRNMLGLVSVYEEAVYEAYLTSPSEYSRLRKELLDFFEHGKISENISEFKATFEVEMEKARLLEKKKKSARLNKLIEKFGTSEDRQLLNVDRSIRPGTVWTGELGVASGRSNDIIPLIIAGVDPRTYALTRELSVTGLGTPYVGNLGSVWRKSLRSAIQNETRPDLGKATCKITVSPVNVKSTDEITTQWIEWLKGE